MSGDANEIAVASASGSRVSAEKLREHAADAEQAAAELAERPACAHRGRELAADGIDQHHRQDGEGAAEKHHLPDRRNVAELAHQRGHEGEQQRGNQFQADGLEWMHHGLNESSIHTGTAPRCHRGCAVSNLTGEQD